MNEEVVSKNAEEAKPEVTQAEAPAAEAQETKVETPEAKTEETKPARKRDGMQDAINRQTRKYYEEKARADALEAQLKRMNSGSAPETNTNAQPDRSKFENDADYVIAVAREEAKKIAAAELSNLKRSEEAKAQKDRFEKDAAEVRKEDPNFDEDFQDFIHSPNLTEAVDKAILASDRPAAVSHYLWNNPEEAEKIAKMSDFRAAIEIGKIEIKLATKPAAKKVSAAPAPITPVVAKGSSGEIDPEKESPKEFAMRRNRERAEKGKR